MTVVTYIAQKVKGKDTDTKTLITFEFLVKVHGFEKTKKVRYKYLSTSNSPQMKYSIISTKLKMEDIENVEICML